MKSRLVVVFIGLSLLWGILVLRAASLQFLPNEKLASLKNRQFKTVVTLQPRRGLIMDRQGRELALSTKAFSLYADPQILDGRKALSRRLAKELGISERSVYSKIRDPQKRFIWIQRMIDPEKAERIKSWEVRGLGFVEEWKRVYPNESVLAPTLGFLGIEGQGLEGLELQYEQTLRGNSKKVSVRRDARGRPLVADGLLFTENPDGHDLKLTIDSEIQYVLESELSQAVKDFEATSAVGVVLDVQTSAIRAMAAVPTFDANRALRALPELRRNRCITDTFEPGSTLKTFVVAAALKQKKLQPNTKFFCENGRFKVADRIVREADAHHRFGWLTASEILAVSSNIGTTKIAFEVGDEDYRQTLLDFGFGAKSGVDLPGEARGTLLPLPWRSHLLANVSFGQGIAATPLQMANAYAAIANGGVLNSPYIVQSVHDTETGRTIETAPKAIRRVLTPEEASQMRLMLTSVTSPGGTGGNAKVPGFIVGGKTGTAQKVNPKGRGYLQGAYISSFAGFIPAHDPRFVIFIAVDEPKKGYYGSQVAAPVFSKVASYAVRREGLAPLLLSEKNLIRNKPTRPERRPLEGQEPVSTAAEVITTLEPRPVELVPDFSKLTLREVLRRVNGKDLKVKVFGRGTVSTIYPPPGAPVPADREITILLK